MSAKKQRSKKGNKELCNDKRAGIIRQLMGHLDRKNVKNLLQRGAFKAVAKHYPVTETTISRTWSRAFKPFKNNVREWPNNFLTAPVANASSQKHRCGRRNKWSKAKFRDAIRKVSKEKRKTYRSTANAMGIPLGTVFRAKKKGWLRSHSNAVKPMLDALNRDKRIRFAAEHVISDGFYHDMMDEVHVDEKWFYIIELI